MSRECREGIRMVVIGCGGVYFYAHARSKFWKRGGLLYTSNKTTQQHNTQPKWIEERGGC